jgi:hypothetical protein
MGGGVVGFTPYAVNVGLVFGLAELPINDFLLHQVGQNLLHLAIA